MVVGHLSFKEFPRRKLWKKSYDEHQFSSVQSLSHVWLFVTLWTAAHQASLSITNSWSLPKLMSIESVRPQPSHPLSSPSSPALNLSQHQGLFQWVSSSHQVAKVLEFHLDRVLKSRDIILPTKVHIVKAMVFPVVMYGCESWTIKKAGHWKVDAFELWCWRRRFRVPLTARTSNQSILKEINLEYSLEGLMLKLQSLSTWCKEPTHWKRPWC